MTASNPFVSREVAERYAKGRPYHHRRTVERCLTLGPGVPDGLALDVACGTGLSTRAMAELGFEVVGVDLTPSMVAVARQKERLPFVVAGAESLPARSASVALLTVGSGLHWFDAARFYEEAIRVLAPGGWLLVYEHAGVDLNEDEGFSAWISEVYLSRFPSPPTPGPWLAAVDPPEGLAKAASESWVDTVEFSHDELVAYFLTQGNVSNPIDSQALSLDDAHQWLLDETAPFFGSAERRRFLFLVMAELFVAHRARGFL
jgi:SAM-dependent methyltransferase